MNKPAWYKVLNEVRGITKNHRTRSSILKSEAITFSSTSTTLVQAPAGLARQSNPDTVPGSVGYTGCGPEAWSDSSQESRWSLHLPLSASNPFLRKACTKTTELFSDSAMIVSSTAFRLVYTAEIDEEKFWVSCLFFRGTLNDLLANCLANNVFNIRILPLSNCFSNGALQVYHSWARITFVELPETERIQQRSGHNQRERW